jgi:sirohydrochlorin cobaltochelatase
MQSHACAYFLVAHGSRDARSMQALHRLTTAFAQAIHHGLPTHAGVGSGTLEFHPQSLPEQLVHFCQGLPSTCRHVKVLPLLLLSGNHVQQDIPMAIAQAQAILKTDYVLESLPYLGSHPQIQRLIQGNELVSENIPWILMAHGSHRQGANQVIEQLAQTLGMHSAFWVGPPSLEEQVLALMSTPHQQIGIVPYFLFPGRITDAIAEQAEQLELKFKPLTLSLLPPLASAPTLIPLIVDLCICSAGI